MFNNEVISARQLRILVLIFVVGSSVLYIPSILTAEAKQDGWIVSVFGSAIGLLIAKLIFTLAKIYPEMNFAQYSEVILGKWLGKLINVVFFINFFMLSGFVLRDVGDFLTIQIMPKTPIHAILIMFALVGVMAVRLGLETLARTGEIFFPWLMIMMLILLLTLTPQVKFLNLQPMFEFGYKTIMRTSLPFIANPFLQLSVFLMIFPNVKDKVKAEKSFLVGVVMGSIILVICTLIAILVLGSYTTSINFFPTYALAKKISIGNLERIEVLMGLIWIISIFFKLSLSLYASTLALAYIFNLKGYKFLTLPLSMILVVLAIVVYPNIASTGEFVKWMFSYFATMGLVIPVLLLIGSKIRSIKFKNH
ncbi:endospore germination permease [Metabacillus halosaccharovorans]|uniref:GerAB/ArcD/ProY family transporter n=2 Tax=Metabacillus halosaccharovorans TaxID=930124 RepID=UPI00203BA443|nr:endospore germination permease [Metabacillus halosaccharovorans]MCM3443859.1 spore germination protein [Metabacillus halosaccharovorans]